MRGKEDMRKIEDTVRTLGDSQVEALKTWIEASRVVPGWIDGYGLGHAYIDIRARGGRGYATRRRYIALDKLTANAVPELRGIRWREIDAALTGAGMIAA